MSSSNYLFKTLKLSVFSILVILLIRGFIFEPGKVNGRSMESNFFDNNIFLVNKIPLLFRIPKRGEVVQFYDEETKKYLIKRVIGFPGERIKIAQNKVFIIDQNDNLSQLKEPYLDPYTITATKDGKPIIYAAIPANSYFLLGDNREQSTDSRDFGPIQRSYVFGVVYKIPFLRKH